MRRPPHVLHVVPALLGGKDGIFGGAERYALELARNMAKVVPTRLLTFGESHRQQRLDELDIRILKAWHVRGQRSNPLAWGLFPEIARYDVIHLHQQHILASSLTALAGRCLRRRVFVTDLGGGGWDISGYLSTDRWFDGHLHISEYSRQVFHQAGKPWSHVIWGGVDANRFVPAITANPRPSVLFVGRILPHKGIDLLVRALPEGMALDIVGPIFDTRYQRDLEILAQGKLVTFHRAGDDQYLLPFYQNALCIVLPSVFRDMYGGETKVPELLGQTLLEGMACGIPAICTAVASMPEIVTDGVTGFIVPPDRLDIFTQRLEWLRDHPVERLKMGQAARADVLERFTWQRVVDRCLAIYRGEH